MNWRKQFLLNLFTKGEIRSLIFLEVVAGIFLSIASLALFLFITNAVIAQQTIFIDKAVESFVYSLRQDWLTKVMHLITLFGNQALIVGSIIVILFLTKRKHKKETFIFSLLLLMGLAVTMVLKVLLKIPRPDISMLTLETSYSYPSGHALNSFLFYFVISFYIFHFTRSKLTSMLFSILSVIIVFSIGISRIYLGVHHPTDIIAGYIAGFWLFATTILVDKTIVFFRLIREGAKITD